MKKYTIFPIILFLINSILQGAQDDLPIKQEKPFEGDNIKGGLFVGLSLAGNTTSLRFQTDQNIYIYDIGNDDKKVRDAADSWSIGFEARIGFIKTFKTFGIRIYGYGGKNYGFYKTIGFKPTLFDKDNYLENEDKYTQNGYIDMTYYGGIADLLFGNFKDTNNTTYVFFGGGVQITDYNFNGNLTFGEKVPNAFSAFESVNLYKIPNKYRQITKGLVFNVGAGTMYKKHHLFEMSARVLLDSLCFTTENKAKYLKTYSVFSEPTHNQLKYENATIKIKNMDLVNLGVNFTYSYIF